MKKNFAHFPLEIGFEIGLDKSPVKLSQNGSDRLARKEIQRVMDLSQRNKKRPQRGCGRSNELIRLKMDFY